MIDAAILEVIFGGVHQSFLSRILKVNMWTKNLLIETKWVETAPGEVQVAGTFFDLIHANQEEQVSGEEEDHTHREGG